MEEQKDIIPLNIDLCTEQFLCCLGLRNDYMKLFPKKGFSSIEDLLYFDENKFKTFDFLNDSNKTLLIRNLNLLRKTQVIDLKSLQEINCDKIRETIFDLGGQKMTKEIIIEGHKLKDKSFSSTLQAKIEKNIKNEKIFASFLSKKNINEFISFDLFKNLKHLYLNENKIQEMKNLDFLVNLTILELSGNFIRKIENLDNLKNLKSLNLEKNLINKISNLSSNSELTDLNLSYQNLPERVILEIDSNTLPLENSLTNLNIEGCHIVDISSLKIFSKIKILKAKENYIENLNSILEAVKLMANLEYLSIQNNPINESPKTCRDILVIYCPFLSELDNKVITKNERSFLNSFYQRKKEKKFTNHNEKDQIMSLTINKLTPNQVKSIDITRRNTIK